MRSALVLVLLTSAVVLAACGNDTASTATPAPTIDFAAEARRLVGDAVFSAEDLPGFAPLGADNLQSQVDLSDQCDVFDPAVIFPDAVATADSGAYADALDDQLVNLAGIYRTAEDASASLARTREIRDRCEDEFEVAVETVARDFLADLGIDTGYRMHVNVNLVITSQQYNLHAIVVREGRVAGALLYGRFGPPDDIAETELLRLMAGKLSAVNASLPE